MSVLDRLRAAFTKPLMDADGWFVEPVPEFDPGWAWEPDPIRADWMPESSRLTPELTARPCAQWTRELVHDNHRWQDAETATPHACPGWRGAP